jgi:two-component system response regulator MprA
MVVRLNPQTQVRVHPPTILIAEDNEPLRAAMSAGLCRAGFRVIEAADGSGAIRAAHRDRPDLILMDLMMPHVDGWAAMEALRSDPHTSGIPVIVCSAALPDMDRIRTVGFRGCVPKPMRMAALVEAVQAHLRLGRRETADSN